MSKKEKFLSIKASVEAKRQIISAFCQDLVRHTFKGRAKGSTWGLTKENLGILVQDIWSIPDSLPPWLNKDLQVDIFLISRIGERLGECIKIAAIPAREGISYHALAKMIGENGRTYNRDAFSNLPQEMHGALFDAIECLRKNPEIFLALSPLVIK